MTGAILDDALRRNPAHSRRGFGRALLLASASAGVVAAAAWAVRARAKRQPRRGRVPFALKGGYAGFLCVLVPVYWTSYGPTNFLWLSDLALFGTMASLALEEPLPASMAAVGVLPLELAWNVDFVAAGRLLGLAGYMFDPAVPAGLRALSIFHVALPPTLLWLMRRLGYDRRAFARQTLLLAALLPLTYAVTDPARNINWVFGPGPEPQRKMPGSAYVAVETAAIALLAMLPTHMVLKRLFPPPPGGRAPCGARRQPGGSSP